MMTTMDSDSNHPVTERLLDAGISEAVIIDDAYDLPAYSDIEDEIADFWATISRDNNALDELRGIEPNFVNDADFDEELIKKLWNQYINQELSSLDLSCQHNLFPRQTEGLSELAPLVANLIEIGITPILLGIGDDLPDEQLKLFFLDFFLDSRATPPSPAAVEDAIDKLTAGIEDEQSTRPSIEKAKQVIGKFDDPFIVLMSSKDGVERARDSFRKQTGLIEGMYDYASKENLAKKTHLHLTLGISAAGLPVRHEIQRFVNAFESSVTKAMEEFISRIKSLSFEDYLYIYSLSLRTEGHPLGDYMSGLYKSLVGHLVIDDDEVIDAQNRLDQMEMDTYVPLKRAPSPNLAEMYRLSLTEPGRFSEGTPLRLGDLYVRDAQDVLLVINADCDLAYSSQNPRRPFPERLSVLLHPGKLKQIEESVDPTFKVTKLFFLDGKAFKIVWNHERVITKEYSEVDRWLEGEGYSKKARLISSHALEIQQHFAAKLTRVGLPVAPPFPSLASVQVFGKNEDGTLAKLGVDIPKGAVIDQEGFRFTVGGFKDILERVSDGINHYEEIRECIGSSNRRYGRIGSRIEKLQAFQNDCHEWFSLIENSHALPSENGRQIGSNGIFQVFHTPNLECAECIIALNLVSDGEITSVATIN